MCTIDEQKKSPVEKVGTIHGDLWSEVRNRHSRQMYLILTQPVLGSDTWVTHIFSLVHKKALFGLLTFTAMDFNRPLATFRRNTEEEATRLHAQIQGIVTHEKEEDWCAFLPAPTPPEGDPGAAQQRRSKPVGQTHSQEPINDEPCKECHAKCQCGGRSPTLFLIGEQM